MNNLYGGCMMQYLPTSEFEWVDKVDVMKVADDADYGYVLSI